MIYLDDAIDALKRRVLDLHIESDDYKDVEVIDLQIMQAVDAFKALEALPSAQPEQRWVPVTERLPEGLAVKTLISRLNSTGLPVVPEIAVFSSCKKEWYIFDGRFEYVVPRVVAWMPLPEPYSEEEV